MSRLAEDARLREKLGAAGREYAVSKLSRALILPQLERACLGG